MNARMRRMSRLAVLLLAVLLVLAGCNKDKKEEAERIRLAEALSSEDFDAMAAGIADGSDIPERVECFRANTFSDELTDPETVTTLWNDLCDLEVNMSEPVEKPEIDDGEASFDFKWADGRSFKFYFITDEFFSNDGGQTFYAVSNPAMASNVFKEAYNFIAEKSASNSGDAGRPIEFSQFGFEWDGDGDGTPEYYGIDFQDNGDEAQSFIAIKPDGGGQEIYIDGAYEIKEIKVYTEEGGKEFLVITYTFGDHSSHDAVAYCEIRFEDGGLTSEVLEK